MGQHDGAALGATVVAVGRVTFLSSIVELRAGDTLSNFTLPWR